MIELDLRVLLKHSLLVKYFCTLETETAMGIVKLDIRLPHQILHAPIVGVIGTIRDL